MRVKKAKISDLLTQVRQGVSKGANPTVSIVYFEDDFIRDQVMLKLKRECEIRQFGEDLESFKSARKGLFKPAVAMVYFSDDLIQYLTAKRPAMTTIIEVYSEDLLENEAPTHCLRVQAHASGNMVEAFQKWAAGRGFTVDPEAIKYGLDYLYPDELKIVLDYLSFRDDGFVSYKAVEKHLEEFEGNIFNLMDKLLSGNRWHFEADLMLLLETNPPQKILSSLLTQTQNVLFSVQGHDAKVPPSAVANVTERSEGAIKVAYDKVKSMHFNTARAVYLYNALIGLTLQLRRGGDLTPAEIMRVGLLKYFVSCGHLGV